MTNVFDIKVEADHGNGSGTGGERKGTSTAGAGGLLASVLRACNPGDTVTVTIEIREAGDDG